MHSAKMCLPRSIVKVLVLAIIGLYGTCCEALCFIPKLFCSNEKPHCCGSGVDSYCCSAFGNVLDSAKNVFTGNAPSGKSVGDDIVHLTGGKTEEDEQMEVVYFFLAIGAVVVFIVLITVCVCRRRSRR